MNTMIKPVVLRPGVGDNRPTATLYYGQDTRETLKALPEASVHTVCTSPPYFGLRDYGAEGQIGLEPTPEEFVAALVEVFREVKRVLRPDGTLWVNLGDSYAEGGGFSPNSPSNVAGSKQTSHKGSIRGAIGVPGGLKAKDLIGIPWRVAFALQADGWYLRQDIIWHKPNPMPEAVTDRCTKSHEYVFLFAHPDSRGRYFYDAEAVKEPVSPVSIQRNKYAWNSQQRTRDPREKHGLHVAEPGSMFPGDARNKRSVWAVNLAPYKGAHFATWPSELVRPMVLAGTSAHGVCSGCGAPWVGHTGKSCPACNATVPSRAMSCPTCGHVNDWKAGRLPPEDVASMAYGATDFSGSGKAVPRKASLEPNPTTVFQGWRPSCKCVGTSRIPATVLDPFSGSATTGMVALQEGRNYIGTDLNPDYLPLAERRVQEEPAPANAETQDDGDAFDLFADG
jgi:DNA modification methylase